MSTQIVAIDTIAGMAVGAPEEHLSLVSDLQASLKIAVHMHEAIRELRLDQGVRPVVHAAIAALQASNSLLTALATKCSLAHPPEDIDVRQDTNGHLVYSCYHFPAHRWDLSGRLLP